jgi:hypothetical protein
MPAPVAGIHVSLRELKKDVDGRVKPGHDAMHFSRRRRGRSNKRSAALRLGSRLVSSFAKCGDETLRGSWHLTTCR